MPECDLDDVAKLHRKIDDFKRRYADFLRRVEEHNAPHAFDINDPKQVEAAKVYDRETASLRAERTRLINEGNELGRELTTCGIKMVVKGGHEIVVEWPDGSTTSIPTGR
jgi:hypothetical protein